MSDQMLEMELLETYPELKDEIYYDVPDMTIQEWLEDDV